MNLVKSNGIQNMIDLEFFIDENGSEYGVTNLFYVMLLMEVRNFTIILRRKLSTFKTRKYRFEKENEEYFKLSQRQMQEIVVLKRKLKDKEK